MTVTVTAILFPTAQLQRKAWKWNHQEAGLTLFTGPYRGTENARIAARARPARSNTRPAREPGRVSQGHAHRASPGAPTSGVRGGSDRQCARSSATNPLHQPTQDAFHAEPQREVHDDDRRTARLRPAPSRHRTRGRHDHQPASPPSSHDIGQAFSRTTRDRGRFTQGRAQRQRRRQSQVQSPQVSQRAETQSRGTDARSSDSRSLRIASPCLSFCDPQNLPRSQTGHVPYSY